MHGSPVLLDRAVQHTPGLSTRLFFGGEGLEHLGLIYLATGIFIVGAVLALPGVLARRGSATSPGPREGTLRDSQNREKRHPRGYLCIVVRCGRLACNRQAVVKVLF